MELSARTVAITMMGSLVWRRRGRAVLGTARLTIRIRTSQHQHHQHQHPHHYYSTPSRPPLDFRALLSTPTWSVRSLLPPDPTASRPDTTATTATNHPTDTDPAAAAAAAAAAITPAQLYHLLRLSALPHPRTPTEEDAMLATLRSQLHFVRAVRAVDTTGVRPLAAIRDETREGKAEGTISLDHLRHVLEAEDKLGPYGRPRRRRQQQQDQAEPQEVDEVEGGWDPLRTAGRTAGRYIAVKTGGKTEGES